MFYIRYRWGYLSVNISAVETDNVDDAIDGEEIFGEEIGGEYDGWLEQQEMINKVKSVISLNI